VNKGVLIPLDDFVKSGRIDVSGWSGAAMSPGVINGKQYGIIYGLVAQGVIYNSKLIQDAGMPLPKDDWTYGEFRQYCMDLQMRLPANAFAVEAAATSDHALEIYMRSRGKSLYNSQGTGLGFDKQDLTDWWNLWEELRGARCIPDLMLAAELSGAPYEQTLFGTNRAAMIFQNANLIPTFQRLVNGEVGVVREPRYNRNIPGDFFQPTMYGISSKTNLVDQSVTFIDWMVNNMEANLIFKAEYGVPGNPRVVKALEDIATDVEKKNYQFSARIFADSTVPPSSARSEGSATVLDTLHRNAYEEAASKTISISAGVDKFFTEASALLARNRPNY
jgi:multiple sugar transport system substrate-binding protein